MQLFFMYIKRYRCAPELFERIFKKWGPLVKVDKKDGSRKRYTTYEQLLEAIKEHQDDYGEQKNKRKLPGKLQS